MTILILGASGPIGDAISKALNETNQSWLALSRKATGPNTIAANREDTELILRLVGEHDICTIIDVIAYTEAGTIPLLKAIDGQIERYVMLSSADVYRNYSLLNRRETGEPTPILYEDAPLRTTLYPYRLPLPRANGAADKWMDDYDKIPLESAAREMTSDYTILRLPMVYGVTGKLDRFNWITKPIFADAERATFALDWLNWTTSYGYIDNVAFAIAHAVTHPSAARETFNIIDTPATPHSDWIKAFASASGWQGEIDTFSTPNPATAHMDLSVSLSMSGERLSRKIGFIPPLSRERCIKRLLSERA